MHTFKDTVAESATCWRSPQMAAPAGQDQPIAGSLASTWVAGVQALGSFPTGIPGALGQLG